MKRDAGKGPQMQAMSSNTDEQKRLESGERRQKMMMMGNSNTTAQSARMCK